MFLGVTWFVKDGLVRRPRVEEEEGTREGGGEGRVLARTSHP